MVKLSARAVLDRIAGPLVLFTALAIAVMYWQGRHAEAENAARDRAASDRAQVIAECQSRFNRAVVINVRTRDELRIRRDTASEAVFARIGEIVRVAQRDDPEALRAAFARFRVAFVAYEVAIRQLNAYKRAHPLPDFPDCDARADRAAASPSPAPS